MEFPFKLQWGIYNGRQIPIIPAEDLLWVATRTPGTRLSSCESASRSVAAPFLSRSISKSPPLSFLNSPHQASYLRFADNPYRKLGLSHSKGSRRTNRSETHRLVWHKTHMFGQAASHGLAGLPSAFSRPNTRVFGAGCQTCSLMCRTNG